MNGRPRPSWEEYALALARVAATRSEDPHRQVGACILRADHSVASLGYNGAPSGVDGVDWSDRDARRPYVMHAEVNALRYIQPFDGVLLVVSTQPCRTCLVAIAAYGIKRVLYGDEWDRPEAADMLFARTLGIRLARL